MGLVEACPRGSPGLRGGQRLCRACVRSGALEAQAPGLGSPASACVWKVSICATGGGFLGRGRCVGFGEEARLEKTEARPRAPAQHRARGLGTSYQGSSSCARSPVERAGLSFREHRGPLVLPQGRGTGVGSAVGGAVEGAQAWMTPWGSQAGRGCALTLGGHRGATTPRGPHFPLLLGCWQPCPQVGCCDCREGSGKLLGGGCHLFSSGVPGVRSHAELPPIF